MIAKTPGEKEKLRAAGKLLARVLRDTAALVKEGVTTAELDVFAEKEIVNAGAVPIFLGYENDDAPIPFPAAICISVNEEVVHGIPSENRVLQNGDILSLDLGLSLDGFVADSALTMVVGEGTADDKKLIRACREAIEAGIKAAKVGNTTGSIGSAVSAVAQRYGVGVVRDLGGHGTGRDLHESPFVPNWGKSGEGEDLEEGMVLAIEPIFTLGEGAIKLAKDGWTYKTRDTSRAAHFEHTILITKDGPEILTQ